MAHPIRWNTIVRAAIAVPGLLFLTGCESWLLRPDTVDIASTVAPIYLDQTLDNLARVYNKRSFMPSLIDIGTGTVTVNGAITPTATLPFGNTVERGAAASITTVTNPYRSLTFGASLTRSGSWNVAAVTDAARIQNIEALYKYAVFAEPAQLVREYRLPTSWNGNAMVVKVSYLTGPLCVFCLYLDTPGRDAPQRDEARTFVTDHHITSTGDVPEKLVKNEAHISRLLARKAGWLRISDEAPPPGAESLGRHDGKYVFVQNDEDRKHLLDFMLFMLPPPAAARPPS